MRFLYSIILSICTLAACSCSNGSDGASASGSAETTSEAAATSAKHPFSADSAYRYVEAQVAMGPRVAGSRANKACAEYLVAKLRSFGADSAWIQHGNATAFNGDKLPINNVLAHFQGTDPQGKRVLLMAHFDTRPWADKDPDEANRTTPIDGANDGASGVGVILEIARQIGQDLPEASVDILFCDAEDYGEEGANEDSWCLGTQYYLANSPFAYGTPSYGILLDMVGGRDACFYYEYFSEVYAKAINRKVWDRAAADGYGSRFVKRDGGAITDDHLYLNRYGVPTIDIIEMHHPLTGSFPPAWHTLDDNLSNIDAATLGAVGQVVTDVIYNEKSSKK